MVEKQLAGRDLNLDFIRGLAAFLVISVHFMMMTEFYYQPMAGGRMLLLSMVRMAFMNCVPLFLILSGYLCCEKKLTRRYYLGVLRVVVAYLLCSGVSLFYRRKFMGETMTIAHAGRLVLDYTGIATGWYIEMYLGLFLLIPFLNMLWRGAETKNARKALIITLVALTAIPTLVNVKYSIVPDWWKGIYPLTYYYLGAWFRTYDTKVRLSRALPAFLAAVAAGGVVVYLTSRGQMFQWTDATDWAGPTVVLSAALLFLMLRQIKTEGAPKAVKWLIYKGSQLSLNIYLVSWCFDNAFYPILWQKIPVFMDRMPWYPVMTFAVYICSALVAQVLEWIGSAALRGVNACLRGKDKNALKERNT